MFSIRRAALRLLATPSASFVTRPRSLHTFTQSALRANYQIPSIQYQKRWATSEAESKKEEAPISQIQPTGQEEVENAIIEDNAEATESLPVESTTTAESTYAEAFDDSTQESSRQGSRPPRFQSDRPPATPKATIYISNLFFDVTENDLVKEMARFGAVQRIRIVRDARGLSKGFGYVQFDTVESATAAIERLNQQLFEGRRLNVQYAATESGQRADGRKIREPKPLNPPTKTLFIGNMSFEMTDRDLNNLFRGIRNIIDVRVAIDRRTGQPRGFAHADFVDVKSAMEAMKVLEGKEVYGRVLRLDYSYGPSHAPRTTDQQEE